MRKICHKNVIYFVKFLVWNAAFLSRKNHRSSENANFFFWISRRKRISVGVISKSYFEHRDFALRFCAIKICIFWYTLDYKIFAAIDCNAQMISYLAYIRYHSAIHWKEEKINRSNIVVIAIVYIKIWNDKSCCTIDFKKLE